MPPGSRQDIPMTATGVTGLPCREFGGIPESGSGNLPYVLSDMAKCPPPRGRLAVWPPLVRMPGAGAVSRRSYAGVLPPPSPAQGPQRAVTVTHARFAGGELSHDRSNRSVGYKRLQTV